MKKIFYLTILFAPLIFLLLYFLKPRVSLPPLPSFPVKPVKPKVPWLKTQGRNIVDQNGKVVVLRGVNMASLSWEEKDWHPKAVEKAVKEWQVNVIRTRILEEEYFKNKKRYIRNLEEAIISQARKEGVYVVLQAEFDDKRDYRVKTDLATDKQILMWQEIAKHYKDDPTILFDPLAEPRGVSEANLRENYIKIIRSIRKVHPRSLILATGVGWGRYINFWLDNPLSYPNIVYRSNPYNRKGELEGLFGRIAKTYPVFLAEFGAEGTPYMNLEDVKYLLSYADKLQISWTAWNFSSSGCPCLLKNKIDFTPSLYGQVIKEALKDSALKQEKLSFMPQIKPSPLPQDRVVIFDEGLQNGFVNYSWETEVELLNAYPVFSGTYSLKFAFEKEYGALFLSRVEPFSIADSPTLNFCLSGDPQGLELGIWGEKDKKIKIFKLRELSRSFSGSWQCFQIDLSKVVPKEEKIVGFVLQDKKETKEPFFLDLMYLEK